MSNQRLIFIIVLAVAAVACAPLRRGGGSPQAYVIFSNQSLDQADVYAVTAGGARTRIGTVFAGRTDTLKVRTGAVGGDNSATIVARILARSLTPSTGRVTIMPGEWVSVTLPPDERILSVLPVR